MRLCPNCFTTRKFQNNTCVICGYFNQINRDKRVLPSEKMLTDRYVVGRVLGIGGFGITYVAYDTQKKERVAIKEYFPNEWAIRIPENHRIEPNSEKMESLYQHGQAVFVNEARILSELQDVPNVVNVKNFFLENGTAYMVMELLEGNTLSGYIRDRNMTKGMSYEAATNVVKEVGLALCEVHKHMLLHRDVSPDNIMLTNNNEVCLIDFGATRMYALNSPTSMSVLVKPGFAPIEQYSRAGNQGPWTDVYALASTYYYLLTGRKPPEAPERIAGVEVTPLQSINTNIPSYVNDAVMKALSEDWRKRQSGMMEFLQEMQLFGKQPTDSHAVWGWEKNPQYKPKKELPCVLLQIGAQRTRYYFMPDYTLSIGRDDQMCNVRIEKDRQVSGFHCKLWYDFKAGRFILQNYSSNRTYTKQRALDKNQGTYLMRGEWFYIQTKKERYIFYLEVE